MQSNQSMNWQGKMLGRYQLVRPLGRGGMGEVWLAEDSQLRRQVAVKLLPAVLATDKQYLQAFAYEARAAAALEHPYILQVHDFGEQRIAEDEVVTFLVMPYITGGTLRSRISSAKGPLLPDEALRHLKQAAQAIDYAHSQQVLHRDIKPANMLLQQDWLFLADFGLAKLLTASTYRSRTHAGTGTPEYMAPEQAQGHAEAASDRYSLAMTAYQLFTGHVSFKGDTPYEILVKQIKEAPPRPRQLNPQIPAAVEEVLLKGLAKSPGDRYGSCMAFVEALEQGWKTASSSPVDKDATLLAPWSKRLRENRQSPPLPFSSLPPAGSASQPPQAAAQPVQAPAEQSPQPAIQPFQPFAAQPLQAPVQQAPSKYLTAPALGVSPMPHTGYPGGFTQEYTPTVISNKLQEQGQEQKRKMGRRRLLIGGAAAAVLTVGGGATLAAFLWTPTKTSAPVVKPAPGPKKLIPGIPVLNLTAHTNTVKVAAWDPTGRYLATAGDDTHVMLWDVGSYLQKNPTTLQSINQPLRNWKFSSFGFFNNTVCWSADGRYLVVSAVDAGKFYLLDVFNATSAPQQYTYTIGANASDVPVYNYVSWQPHTNTLAVSEFGTKIDLWQRNTTTKPVSQLSYDKLKPHVNIGVTSWSVDGSMLMTLTDDGQILVWDAKTRTVQHILELPDRTNGKNVTVLREALACSPFDANMLVASDVDAATVWDIRKDKPLYVLGTDDPAALTVPKQTGGIQWVPQVHGLTWSPNGRYIAGSYGRSASIYMWDLQAANTNVKNGLSMQQFFFPKANDPRGHSSTVVDVAWSPNGRYLASASFDKTVIVWLVDGL